MKRPRTKQTNSNQTNLSSFIWSVADLLRDDYKQYEYGRVILPFTVLHRLDCVLEDTKAAVLKEKEKREAAGINPEPFLLKKSGLLFYNKSPLDFKKLMYRNLPHFGVSLLPNRLQVNSLGQFSRRCTVPYLSHSGLLWSHCRRICPRSRPNKTTGNGAGWCPMNLHKEISFEDEICQHLAEHGWLHADGDAAKYDRTLALFPEDAIAWIQDTPADA